MMTRILAGVIGLIILLPAVILAPPIVTEVIVWIATAIGAFEYGRMAFKGARERIFSFALIMIAFATVLYAADMAYIGMMTLFFAAFIHVVSVPGPDMQETAERLGRHIVGTIWIGATMPALVWLRYMSTEQVDGWYFVLVALGTSWAGDTGAYFAGRFFGKRKLHPRVSPKKTWEGAIGGVLFAGLSITVFNHLMGSPLTLPQAVFVGMVGCILGIYGDLSESVLKRAFDVKDSGGILPGHGGILDRIDSVIFVAPAVWAFLVVSGVS